MKRKLYWQGRDWLFKTGLQSIRKGEKGTRILFYHGVVPNPDKSMNARFISPEELSDQLSYCKSHANIVSVTDLFSGNYDPNELTLALTFDDGYANNAAHALPVLEKLKIPATFCITTSQEPLWPDMLDLLNRYHPQLTVSGMNGKHAIQKKLRDSNDISLLNALQEAYNALPSDFLEQYRWYWQLLDNAAISQLGTHPLITIAAHGQTHTNLSILSTSDLSRELSLPKQHLESLIEGPVDVLAYPFGLYNDAVVQAAEHAGYRYQLAMDYNNDGDRQDPRIQARLGNNPYIGWKNQVDIFMRGYY